MAVRLNDDQMAQLEAMLQQDAANPVPTEETPEMEEAQNPDEVDEINENTQEMDEGDAAAEDPEPVPDPKAGGDPQAPANPAPALPEGMQSVEQLIEAYNRLAGQNTRYGEDMQALRDMNGQLVSIAEALGLGKELESVDLNVDEKLMSENPAEAARREIQKELRSQLKPLVEQQQKNLREKLVDQAWKQFAGEHEDLGDLMDDIREIMKETPDLAGDENGLQVAYHLARSNRYTPEKLMMENENFISRAAQNPKVKEKVIEEYLREVGKSGGDALASVGGGGKAVPTGRKKGPATIKEAHRAFERMAGG